MATNPAQTRWRRKVRYVKTQLNVMARAETHRALDDLALLFGLRGKAEAVTFASFVTRALVQRADYDPNARRLLDDCRAGYLRDRDLHAP